MIQFVAGQKQMGIRAERKPKLICTTCKGEEEIDPMGKEAHMFSSPSEYGRWRVQVFTDKHLDCCI